MSDPEKIVVLPTRKELDAAAAAWLAKLDRDEVAVDDVTAFRKWLAQSDRHKAAFERMSHLWDGMAALEELEDIALSALETASRRSAWTSRRALMALAASLLVFAGAGASLLYYDARRPEIHATGIGEQKTIRLADGSEIQLNTDSHIEVALNNEARRIMLERGEAHFVVARDPQRPFAVFAGGGVFTAIGTAYTVRLRPSSEVEVTVAEGRVAITRRGESEDDAPEAAPAGGAVESATLSAGQNALFTNRIESVEAISPNELTRRSAWRYGLLSYEGEPLSEVISDVSRYTNIRFEIADPELRSLPVGGSFQVGEIDALLDSLELTFNLNVEKIDDEHIRISRNL